jgi:WD40 repeat protein
VGVYDARTGELKRMVDARAPAVGFYMRIALSPAGELLATRGPGEAVQVFRLDSSNAPVVYGSHGGTIRGLAFSSDGRFLASASEDRTAKVWSTASGKEVLTLQGHAGKVISIAFSPDDELIATGSDDRTLRLWEAQTGRTLMVLTQTSVSLGSAQGIQAVAFSPDGH